MVVYVGLLWVSVVMIPTCTALPTQAESTRNTINYITRTTLVHISRIDPMGMASPPIPVEPPTIGDLNSISQYLSLLEAELKGLRLESLAQIEADVSSLNGFVRHLAETLHCLLDADQPVWVGEERFPVTRWHECLRKVQVYLEELLRHTDQLGAC
ncbi:leptin-B-like [Gadus chalcogrammus]|uniref:leptin-B-like n=1 Tax=Gadus chalcogrammus TaxID=1042646 RepID=UPI0024C4A19C|nr:leptin-B-like [Gadus chalcogrammus]